MIDIKPEAPRVVALRDTGGHVLGFAIRIRKAMEQGYSYAIHTEARKGCEPGECEVFRAATMTPIIGWLEQRYGPMRRYA